MGWKLTLGLLRDAWRTYPQSREVIASFPSGRPIFLTGTHRSGTTWAAAMLAEPGLWYVHEPFMPAKGLWPRAFSYADPVKENKEVEELIQAVIRGKKRVASNNPHTGHPLMPLRLFRPPIRRVMIKDPIACLLTGYVARRFDMDIVVLFRHPAGFATSVTRLGWPVGKFLTQFLGDKPLMEQHLEPHASLMEKYQQRDDLEAAAVLHGVLNKVLWSQVQNDPGISYYLFEELCENPIEKFREIFQLLRLPYSNETLQRHEKLCASRPSPNGDYRPHAVSRDSQAVAVGWKKHLDIKISNLIKDIWMEFDIPIYTSKADWAV